MSARSRERSFGTGAAAVCKQGREGRSRLLNEVCELCGYERKYVIKVLSGKRAIVDSNGHKRGGSQAIYGVWNARSSKRFGWRPNNPAASA
jgi:hypothetical protein